MSGPSTLAELALARLLAPGPPVEGRPRWDTDPPPRLAVEPPAVTLGEGAAAKPHPRRLLPDGRRWSDLTLEEKIAYTRG